MPFDINFNSNIFQFINSIWDSIKSTHNHIQEFFTVFNKLWTATTEINNKSNSVFSNFLDPISNQAQSNILIAITGFIAIGFIFVVVDFVRDVI